ncbi:MAG: AraC family transcriptional regulator [Eubacteriales bacterium]|nr:AraC family transcriptional regulator [Eubacteriales bacterium]
MKVLARLCPYIREAGIQGTDDWPRQDRRIYDHQFFYCYKGRGTMQIGAHCYDLKVGSLFVITPNQPHRYQIHPDNPCDCYWFHLDFFERADAAWPLAYYSNTEDYLSCFFHSLPHAEHIRENFELRPYIGFETIVEVKDRLLVEHCFVQIYHAYLEAGSQWQYSALAAFYTLLALLNREQRDEALADTKALRNVNLMKAFIRENYFRKLRVSDITAVTTFHTDYAARLFKRMVGVPINEYLLQFRIRKAKRLLMDLDLAIADVAEMCGFQHESYFSAVIKSREGLSPRELREELLRNLLQNEES